MRRRKALALRSGPQLAILAALHARGSLHGLAVQRHVEEVTLDRARLPGGTLYPALAVLEREGLLASTLVPAPPGQGGRARRVYALTADGRAEALRQREILELLWEMVPAAVDFGGADAPE